MYQSVIRCGFYGSTKSIEMPNTFSKEGRKKVEENIKERLTILGFDTSCVFDSNDSLLDSSCNKVTTVADAKWEQLGFDKLSKDIVDEVSMYFD